MMPWITMTAAINKACIGWLQENHYLVRGVFLVLQMSIFCCWVGFSPHLQGFPQMVWGHWGKGRAVHTWWSNKRDESRGNKSWLWNWKCAPEAKFLIKFVLKLLFFPICGLQSEEGWGEAWRKWGGHNFMVERFRAFSSPSLSCKSWSSIKNTLRSVLDLITVLILERVREYFPSKQQIYSM